MFGHLHGLSVATVSAGAASLPGDGAAE